MNRLRSAVIAFLKAIKRVLTTVTFREARRSKINMKNRERLRNTDFTIISSNCNGGVLYHDLGLPFRSPFINLWMWPGDFIKYLQNMDYYNSIDDIRFLPENLRRGHDYPIGMIGDLEVHFGHYKNDAEALEKWNERKKLSNRGNICVIMSEQNNCTLDDLRAFDALPFENKVVFTKLPYDEIKSAFYVPGFENRKEIATLLAYKNVFSAKRQYDIFPYVDWFNGDYKVGQDK